MSRTGETERCWGHSDKQQKYDKNRGEKMKAGKVLVVERKAELECDIEGDGYCDQTVLIHNEQINCKACQRASGEEIQTTAGEGTERPVYIESSQRFSKVK